MTLSTSMDKSLLPNQKRSDSLSMFTYCESRITPKSFNYSIVTISANDRLIVHLYKLIPSRRLILPKLLVSSVSYPPPLSTLTDCPQDDKSNRKHQISYSTIVQCFHTYLQQGGGTISPSTNKLCRTIIDLTSLPDTAKIDTASLNYPTSTIESGVLQIATNMTQKLQWQPTRPLPVRKGNQPIKQLLTPAHFRQIYVATQQHPVDVIGYLSTIKEQNVTSQCLKELMSHGEMTRDTILNTFLAILCAN